MADTPKTTLWLSPQIVSELMFYAWKVDAEVGGMGLLRFDDNNITVEELFLIDQKVHGTECELSSEAYSNLMADIMAKHEDEKLTRLNFWWHSHKNMGAFFSPTDDTTMREWDGQYQVALVINRKGEMKARLMSRVPVLIIGDIDVEIDWFDVPECENWSSNVKDKVMKQVFTYTPNVPVVPGKAVERVQKKGYNYPYGNYYLDNWDDYEEWENYKEVKPKKVNEMTDDEWKKHVSEVDEDVTRLLTGGQLSLNNETDMDEIEAEAYKQWWMEDEEDETKVAA